VRFRVKIKNSANFIYYFTKSQPYYDQIKALSIESTIQNFNGEKFSNMYVPYSIPEDQLLIANFIESKTSKIDSLISKLQKMIELLKEKRQAIITHAVTKGLDPNVPMKDSGVEWIGEIPGNTWKLVRLKHICKLAYGDSLPSEDRIAGEFPVFGSNGIIDY
ncbi:type I restriction-modification system, S subunit, partial [mine drainage metagenome]